MFYNLNLGSTLEIFYLGFNDKFSLQKYRATILERNISLDSHSNVMEDFREGFRILRFRHLRGKLYI